MLANMVKDEFNKSNEKAYRVAYMVARIFEPPITTFFVSLIFLTQTGIDWDWFIFLLLGNPVIPVFYLLGGYASWERLRI